MGEDKAVGMHLTCEDEAMSTRSDRRGKQFFIASYFENRKWPTDRRHVACITRKTKADRWMK